MLSRGPQTPEFAEAQPWGKEGGGDVIISRVKFSILIEDKMLLATAAKRRPGSLLDGNSHDAAGRFFFNETIRRKEAERGATFAGQAPIHLIPA
jgi:hypothetical protein